MISVFLNLLTNQLTLAIWCQYTVFSTSSLLSVQRWAVAVMAHGLMVDILFPSWVSSRLTFWGCCSVIIWWLQQSLFTDLAGNIFHSCFQISPYHKPSQLYFSTLLIIFLFLLYSGVFCMQYNEQILSIICVRFCSLLLD